MIIQRIMDDCFGPRGRWLPRRRLLMLFSHPFDSFLLSRPSMSNHSKYPSGPFDFSLAPRRNRRRLVFLAFYFSPVRRKRTTPRINICFRQALSPIPTGRPDALHFPTRPPPCVRGESLLWRTRVSWCDDWRLGRRKVRWAWKHKWSSRNTEKNGVAILDDFLEEAGRYESGMRWGKWGVRCAYAWSGSNQEDCGCPRINHLSSTLFYWYRAIRPSTRIIKQQQMAVGHTILIHPNYMSHAGTDSSHGLPVAIPRQFSLALLALLARGGLHTAVLVRRGS